jgi:uncharacterized protein (TIGR03067 family)
MVAGGMLALCLLGQVVAQTPEERRKHEDTKLAGDWRVVSVAIDGKKLAADEVPNLSLTFKNGQYAARMGKEKPQEGTYQIDPGKSPKTIDITRTTDPGKGKKQLGIYELAGNSLKICACEEGNERPTSFDTTDKPGYTVLILRRTPKTR